MLRTSLINVLSLDDLVNNFVMVDVARCNVMVIFIVDEAAGVK